MENLKQILISAFIIVMGVISTHLSAQDDNIKLTSISYEVVTTASPERAWEVLDNFGDVGSYHSGIVSSKSLNGSENNASMGCERECTIENGKKDIVVSERIIEYKEGQYYKYDVFAFENFPAKKFYNTFGVKVNNRGETVIYVKTDYRLKPGFLTGMMKGKLSKGNRDALISYKHFMETGERNVDQKILKKMYPNA